MTVRNLYNRGRLQRACDPDHWPYYYAAVVNKGERITDLVKGLGAVAAGLDPHYAGFFECFNRQCYYEAHDVLEHLWLGAQGDNRPFFKGLIQIAGAFVHLQKQHARPTHPKDGRRLRPAARLFLLGMKNIEPFAPAHMQLDVAALVRLCEERVRRIVASDFMENPWSPEQAPRILLEGHAPRPGAADCGG